VARAADCQSDGLRVAAFGWPRAFGLWGSTGQRQTEPGHLGGYTASRRPLHSFGEGIRGGQPWHHHLCPDVNNDNTLPRCRRGSGGPADIAYLYGSWAPNVAQIPQVVNLTNVVKRPE